MATPISGRDGSVDVGGSAVAEVTGWRFNPTSNNSAWASSDTSGYKNRIKGVLDGSGSIDFKLDKDSSQATSLEVGTEVTRAVVHRQ